MKTNTYTLENNYDSEYSEGASHVRFTLNEEDVANIIKHARYVRENDLMRVEAFDFRCEFFDQDQEEGSLVPSEFHQDAARMTIYGGHIQFTGHQKHGGSLSQWATDGLMIEDIAKDFGVEL